jgi:hypothetical protein
MTSRTSYLGRLIGLYCILFALVMFLQKQVVLNAMGSLIGSPGTMLTLGLILLCTGLALVLAHNLWSGGALTIIVTLVGWITMLKGLLMLVLSPQAEMSLFLRQFHYQQFFYVYAALTLCLGLYVTYAAFRSPSPA